MLHGTYQARHFLLLKDFCLLTAEKAPKRTDAQANKHRPVVLLTAAVMLALAVFFGHMDRMFEGSLGDTMMSAASAKMALDPTEAVIKAILCNILVCLAVWVAMGSTSLGGKAVACFAPVMLFVLCGFEHSIANMYFIPTGLFLGAEGDIGAFLLNNLLPVTIGNILGGALIVGGGIWVLYHPKK